MLTAFCLSLTMCREHSSRIKRSRLPGLSGVLLVYFVHPGFIGLSAFVGAGLVFAGVTDWCGMGLLLAKLPWNQKSGCASGSSCEVKH